MKNAVAPYLSNRGAPGVWQLEVEDTAGVHQVVVIPALGEHPGLFDTLDDLAANDAAACGRTLVIVVVNNRPPDRVTPETLENNHRTIALLRGRQQNEDGPLRLGVVDATSPGHELPPKDGVGLARKIGLDFALGVLDENGRPEAPLICLDADTRVAPNYLDAVGRFFQAPNRWGAVVDYIHPTDGPDAAAALHYEFYLRYHVLGLHYAGSPYAYPSIGSTMAFTGRAYAAAGGMKRREAAEDFYFLQELAKGGPIAFLHDTTVQPSGRASDRVPFGTGRSIREFSTPAGRKYTLYHPASYAILGEWLRFVERHLEQPVKQLLAGAMSITPELHAFLETHAFAAAWQRIQNHSASHDQLRRQFHCWFDGFRTLKLIHHLRENSHPEQEMFASLATLFDMAGWDEGNRFVPALRDNLPAQRAALGVLRERSRHELVRAGLGA